MTGSQLVALVRRHQSGLLLDTNVLLLHLIDQANPDAVSAWKQTRQFTAQHAVVIRAAVSHARRLVTTPHILTEVTNLSRGIPTNVEGRYWAALRAFIAGAKESWCSATKAAASPAFERLGLADVVQGLRRRAKPLVATADAELVVFLETQKVPVLNPNHFVFPVA